MFVCDHFLFERKRKDELVGDFHVRSKGELESRDL